MGMIEFIGKCVLGLLLMNVIYIGLVGAPDIDDRDAIKTTVMVSGAKQDF